MWLPAIKDSLRWYRIRDAKDVETGSKAKVDVAH
jgi:hypothetical protein